MDFTKSLMEQPDLARFITELAIDHHTYVVIVEIAVIYGIALGMVGYRPGPKFLNPLTVLDALLTAGSAIAPIPLAWGLGCFGLHYAETLGSMFGAGAIRTLRNGPIIRMKSVRRRFADAEPGIITLIATGRARARLFSVYAAGFAAFVSLIDGSLVFPWLVVAAVPYGLSLKHFRPALWSLYRRRYRRWTTAMRPVQPAI